MNIFVASLLLYQTTLEDFLEKSADDRLLEYADIVGIERMVRAPTVDARRAHLSPALTKPLSCRRDSMSRWRGAWRPCSYRRHPLSTSLPPPHPETSVIVTLACTDPSRGDESTAKLPSLAIIRLLIRLHRFPCASCILYTSSRTYLYTINTSRLLPSVHARGAVTTRSALSVALPRHDHT